MCAAVVECLDTQYCRTHNQYLDNMARKSLTAIYRRHKANDDGNNVDKDNSDPSVVREWITPDIFIDIKPVALRNIF